MNINQVKKLRKIVRIKKLATKNNKIFVCNEEYINSLQDGTNYYTLPFLFLFPISNIEKIFMHILVFGPFQTLLQDAANATLRSETLRRNCVRCNNRKRGCKKPVKKVQNVCDGGAIKHGSDIICVCDAGHMVNPFELFAMR